VREFDREMGERIANFSRIAYCPEPEILDWTCSVCQDSLRGFEIFYKERENYRHVGVYAGYYPAGNQAVIVFRGTDYVVNWIQDLMIYKVDAEYDCGYYPPIPPHKKPKKRKCMVHSGFKMDWLSVREQVLNATAEMLDKYPTAQIWVAGHSLGGALAALCAVDLQVVYKESSSTPKQVNLFTLGQPRVGNQDFSDFVWEQLPTATRVVHQNDVVPHLPPRGYDLIITTQFHHHAREIWQTGKRRSHLLLQ
jgi:predicted lipase